MPPQTPIQPTFASGEVSPHIYSRVDIQKYQSALRRCRNFIIHPYGGASNRPGMRYVATAKHSDRTARVVRFIFSTQQAYVLEVGHEYVRFYTDQAQINVTSADYTTWNAGTAYVVNDYALYSSLVYRAIQAGTNKQPNTNPDYWTQQTIYEIYTPYQEADLALLRFESSADVIWITHPDYQPYTLSRFGDTDWRLELYEPEDGPFMPENLTDTTLTANGVTGSITLTASAALFAALHVGSLWKLRHYIPGQSVSAALSSATSTSSIKCFTTWRLITHGTWTGNLSIEKSDDGGSSWTKLRTFSSVNDFNVNTSGTEDVEVNTVPFLVRVTVNTYTSGTINVDLTTDAFFQEGIAKITVVNSNVSANATVLTEIGTASQATSSWSEGSWSDYRGWPSVARFFADRLVFSHTYTEPMTSWMTKLSSYFSYVRHSPLLDTDGISLNLPSRQLNAINGLVALRRLVAFTSGSEWSIGSVDGAGVTPTTVNQLIEGYRGSYGLDPAVVGNECIFMQANSKTVRNISFQFQSDTFEGSELNVLAKHLFQQYTIVDIAYQQDPDSVVWFVRDDGKMLGMTYLKEQEVVAWHWHDTEGEIESITTIPGDGFDELWLVVNRTNGRFIERMTQRQVTANSCAGTRDIKVENQLFLDAAVTFKDEITVSAVILLEDNVLIIANNHGLNNGDQVKIDDVVYAVKNATTNTFKIEEV